MNEILIIGAGKFAVELADYITDSVSPDGAHWTVAGFLAMEGEPVAAPPSQVRTFDFQILSDTARFALGIADMDARIALLEKVSSESWSKFPCLVHRTASVAGSASLEAGVVVGPMSRIGANANIGAFTVLNYLCAVSHHSIVGINTFLTPGFQCGNSVNLGAHSFYGVNSSVGPGVQVGSGARVQAGAPVLESVDSNMSVFSSNRQKSIKRGNNE